MNTKALLLTAAFGLTSALALADNPVWDPGTFTPGEDYLVAGWNFNDNTDTTTLLSVSHGTGTLTTNWATDNISDFTGVSTNAYDDDPNGRDLALVNGGTTGNPANEGNWLQFNLNTTNLESLVMTYAGRTTATGMRELTWSYSTDGTLFTDFQTVDHNDLFDGANYGLVTLDFSSILALNNQSSINIRGTITTLDGQSSPQSAGNTRFDNVQFNAVAIPEPGTLMLVGLTGVAGLLAMRRRRK